MNVRPLIALALLQLIAACSHGAASNASSATAAGTATTAPSVAAVGQKAPAWSELTSEGAMLSMASLAGKPVYLNFFASWCPPCNEEAPSINTLQKLYLSKGLRVIGVDVQENAAKAQGFREKYHLVYPAVVDSGTLRDEYSVNGLPVHVFIDRKGIVRSIRIGELTPSQINRGIQQIL